MNRRRRRVVGGGVYDKWGIVNNKRVIVMTRSVAPVYHIPLSGNQDAIIVQKMWGQAIKGRQRWTERQVDSWR